MGVHSKKRGDWHLKNVVRFTRPFPYGTLAGKRHRIVKIPKSVFQLDMPPPPDSVSLKASAAAFVERIHGTRYWQDKVDIMQCVSGKTLRIGTACSGSDGPIPALRHLFHALQDDGKGIPVDLSHTFSVEVDATKRRWITENAHHTGDGPEYLIADVAEFGSDMQPTDVKSGKLVEDEDLEVDILIYGFSCKTVSTMYQNRGEVLNCLSTGQGTSGETYKACLALASSRHTSLGIPSMPHTHRWGLQSLLLYINMEDLLFPPTMGSSGGRKLGNFTAEVLQK